MGFGVKLYPNQPTTTTTNHDDDHDNHDDNHDNHDGRGLTVGN
jgi:hypothetical protein